MSPGLRVLDNPDSTVLQIDHWTVSTVAPPQSVTVDVDITRTRSIGGVNALDRYTWFGVYHETGYGNKVVDGKKVDEWIWEEGRMWPSRGTLGYAQFPEDPARPSYADPVAISNFTGKLEYRYTDYGKLNVFEIDDDLDLNNDISLQSVRAVVSYKLPIFNQ